MVVTGEASQVDTTTSSLGTPGERQVRSPDLPLNGRNFVDLTLLQTGVVNFQFNTFAANNLFGEFYSSNGAPLRSNMYTLDGAIMGNIAGASASSISGNSLGIDGIREYKVMTNTFSAEYGLAMGSQMTIVIERRIESQRLPRRRIRIFAEQCSRRPQLLRCFAHTAGDDSRRRAPHRSIPKKSVWREPRRVRSRRTRRFSLPHTKAFRQLLDDNPPALGITPFTMPAACHVAAGQLTVTVLVETVNSACDATLKGNAQPRTSHRSSAAVRGGSWLNPNIEPGDQFAYLASQVNQ